MARYLAGFARDMKAIGCRAAPYVFHSNGGLLTIETASRFPVRTCVSGPAAGQPGVPAFVLFLGGLAVVCGAVLVWIANTLASLPSGSEPAGTH